LFSVPFIFPELHILAFFSGVPFFIVLFDGLAGGKKNKALRYTFVFGMSFYLPVYIWFLWMYPMEQTGVTPLQSAAIVTAAWFGFPLLQTAAMLVMPLGLKIFGRGYAQNNNINNIFYLPALTAALYVILEWVQSWFFTGLTWAKLSVSQYKNLFFIQSVSVFGTYFTSFLIIFINAALAVYIINRPRNNSRLLIFAAVLLYFANSYFGYFRLMYYSNAPEEKKITAQIIQGNISSYDKWEESGVERSLEIYASLMGSHRDENIDICVFPETAIPGSMRKNGGLYAELSRLAEENGVSLFAGVIYSEEAGENGENINRYNAIAAFDKNHDFIRPYGKRHLVPFGEYLPIENILTKIFPFVANISLFDSALTQGEGSNIMTVNGVNYGGLVCFDSIFPELARQSVRDGAEILIIATNDSWFRDSPAIHQHNAQAALRAVENNRYVVRAANTGISSFISPVGEILMQSDILRREVLVSEVGIVKSKTLYTICGDIILYLSWAYIIFCVYIKIKTKKIKY